jgi:cold shock CspA family protein
VVGCTKASVDDDRDTTDEGEDVTQGTIKHYDVVARTGAVVTDDHVEIAIDAASIGDQHIRTLRLGQRVTFQTADSEGHLVARELHIVTFVDR